MSQSLYDLPGYLISSYSISAIVLKVVTRRNVDWSVHGTSIHCLRASGTCMDFVGHYVGAIALRISFPVRLHEF